MCQIPIDEGGLDGAVAYITTGSASLPTNRLLEIARLHQKTAELDMMSLMDNIHHCRAPTVYALMQILNHNLPSLCDQLLSEGQTSSSKTDQTSYKLIPSLVFSKLVKRLQLPL
jgi:hypothetical protein